MPFWSKVAGAASARWLWGTKATTKVGKSFQAWGKAHPTKSKWIAGASIGVSSAAALTGLHQTATGALSRLSGFDPDYGTYISARQYMDPQGKYPKGVLGRTAALFTGGGILPTGPLYGGFKTTISQFTRVAGLQARIAGKRLSPIARFRMGMARGFREQQQSIRQSPVRPYATRGGGAGYPQWYKRRGGPMPANHLSMSGDINFSLHRLRHKGIIGAQ